MIKIYLPSVRIYSFSSKLFHISFLSPDEKSIFKDSTHLADYSHKISNLEFSPHTVVIKNRRQLSSRRRRVGRERKDGRWKIEGVPPTEKSGNLSFTLELFTRCARRATRDKIFRDQTKGLNVNLAPSRSGISLDRWDTETSLTADA